LALGPKDPHILAIAGLYLCYLGEWDRGLALVERAKQWDPFFPGWYYNASFHSHYRKGEYQAALEDAQRGDMPDFVQSQSQIVAAYGKLGRREEAAPYVKRIRELDANFEATAHEHWWMRFRYQPQYLEQLIDGLREGGLNVRTKVG
jgi:tetratricopeptide (TPR) repeat protein